MHHENLCKIHCLQQSLNPKCFLNFVVFWNVSNDLFPRRLPKQITLTGDYWNLYRYTVVTGVTFLAIRTEIRLMYVNNRVFLWASPLQMRFFAHGLYDFRSLFPDRPKSPSRFISSRTIRVLRSISMISIASHIHLFLSFPISPSLSALRSSFVRVVTFTRGYTRVHFMPVFAVYQPLPTSHMSDYPM